MAPLLAIYIFCKDSFAHSCYWYNAHGPSSPATQPNPEAVATTYTCCSNRRVRLACCNLHTPQIQGRQQVISTRE